MLPSGVSVGSLRISAPGWEGWIVEGFRVSGLPKELSCAAYHCLLTMCSMICSAEACLACIMLCHDKVP